MLDIVVGSDSKFPAWQVFYLAVRLLKVATQFRNEASECPETLI